MIQFVVIIAAVAIGTLIYALIVMWPERPPRHRTVKAIRKRIEAEQEGDR